MTVSKELLEGSAHLCAQVDVLVDSMRTLASARGTPVREVLSTFAWIERKYGPVAYETAVMVEAARLLHEIHAKMETDP